MNADKTIQRAQSKNARRKTNEPRINTDLQNQETLNPGPGTLFIGRRLTQMTFEKLAHVQEGCFAYVYWRLKESAAFGAWMKTA